MDPKRMHEKLNLANNGPKGFEVIQYIYTHLNSNYRSLPDPINGYTVFYEELMIQIEVQKKKNDTQKARNWLLGHYT